ncbi:MAG: tRNA pseudouridine(55) synthase TruB, partial [Vibrio sp.]
TYIRTIVDDLGEMLGCGAHVTMLRRIGVANYPYARMVTLEQLQEWVEQAHREQKTVAEILDPLLLPMDTAAEALPEVNVIAELIPLVQHGQAVQVAGAPTEGMVRITGGEHKLFLGVGEIDDHGRIAPKRLVVYGE